MWTFRYVHTQHNHPSNPAIKPRHRRAKPTTLSATHVKSNEAEPKSSTDQKTDQKMNQRLESIQAAIIALPPDQQETTLGQIELILRHNNQNNIDSTACDITRVETQAPTAPTSSAVIQPSTDLHSTEADNFFFEPTPTIPSCNPPELNFDDLFHFPLSQTTLFNTSHRDTPTESQSNTVADHTTSTELRQTSTKINSIPSPTTPQPASTHVQPPVQPPEETNRPQSPIAATQGSSNEDIPHASVDSQKPSPQPSIPSYETPCNTLVSI